MDQNVIGDFITNWRGYLIGFVVLAALLAAVFYFGRERK